MKPNALILMSGALAVTACGSGGEQVAGIDARGNQNPVAVVSKGTITGFGSVIVNGVTYNTSTTTFTIDGAAGTEADLAVGDVVVVDPHRITAGAVGPHLVAFHAREDCALNTLGCGKATVVDHDQVVTVADEGVLGAALVGPEQRDLTHHGAVAAAVYHGVDLRQRRVRDTDEIVRYTEQGGRCTGAGLQDARA